MNQLRYLIDCKLEFMQKTKRPNGSTGITYEEVQDYKVQLQELDDAVSASIYGANINTMYRINSPKHELEDFLDTKMTKASDNISDYCVLVKGKRYKVLTVRNNWIDVQLI